MTRTSLHFGLLAVFLLWITLGGVLSAQVESPTKRPRIIVLLPEHFRGWACTDFGVAGAPPLPREGDALVIRPIEGTVLRTSDKPTDLPYFSETWFEIGGQRRPLPQDVYGQREVRLSDSKQPIQHYCAFYGTVDEADAAGEPRGFETFPIDREGVSLEERQALTALYRATGGDHWNHHVGWLGPPGTECKWHGVNCWSRFNEPTTVTGLDLFQNNLVGTIPPAAGELKHLDQLKIFGNQISGVLPQELIDRWLTGNLEISAEAPLLTDISKIEFQSDPLALLCGLRRTTLSSNGRATLTTERCRKATPDDRTTLCEIKEGRVWSGDFAKLAWLIEKNGYFDLHADYSRSVSDATSEKTRVSKAGKLYQVENYADAGPFELWVIQRAIEGVSSSIEWDKSTTQPMCPQWDEQEPKAN